MANANITHKPTDRLGPVAVTLENEAVPVMLFIGKRLKQN